MIDVKKIREDFPMFENYKTMQDNRFVYLDNAATSFKPYEVIKASDDYYTSFTANSHINQQMRCFCAHIHTITAATAGDAR